MTRTSTTTAGTQGASPGPLRGAGAPDPAGTPVSEGPGTDGPQIGAQPAVATDLRGRLRAQGYAWDDTEVIATVVDEWLIGAAIADAVANMDDWQSE